MVFFLVEPARVELASENPLIQLSPGAVCLLCFPLISPADGIYKSVSFLFMTVAKENSPFTFAAMVMPGEMPQHSSHGQAAS